MSDKPSDGKPSATEVGKLRAWLVAQGMKQNEAALIAVTSKTRAKIRQDLIEKFRQSPKAKPATERGKA
jgi:hypothetical protein